MKLIPILLGTWMASLCFAASAQWQWVGKDGHKVFSDRAPPPEVQEKDILTRPGGKAPAAEPTVDAAPDAAPAAELAPAPVPSAKPTALDKELEARKKLAQEKEAAKRKAAEEQFARARQDSCNRAKQAKSTLESGVRIGHTNAAGEREIMDDAARAQEAKRIDAIVARDCR
jgi:hypothetical protein